MNIYGGLLFLQGHILNADLARQLAAAPETGDAAARGLPQPPLVRGTCAPRHEGPPSASGATSPCRGAR